jgi:hypothetical protein
MKAAGRVERDLAAGAGPQRPDGTTLGLELRGDHGGRRTARRRRRWRAVVVNAFVR